MTQFTETTSHSHALPPSHSLFCRIFALLFSSFSHNVLSSASSSSSSNSSPRHIRPVTPRQPACDAKTSYYFITPTLTVMTITMITHKLITLHASSEFSDVSHNRLSIMCTRMYFRIWIFLFFSIFRGTDG